jgi:uncharacterized protein YjbI with pentapeptide repeats
VHRNADVHNADVHNADVHNADVHNADVHNADVRNADVHNADVHNADVRLIGVCFYNILTVKTGAKTPDRKQNFSVENTLFVILKLI